jgi:RNA polymerase-binding protein DksA
MTVERVAPRLQEELAQALVRERDRLRRSLRSLEEAARALGESQGEESDAGGGRADVASDLAEQGMGSALVRLERHRLQAVEDALRRMQQGSYGICEACGEPVGLERLYAEPWARNCIRCARQTEGHGS